MPKRARARQALLPDKVDITAQRQALPNFDPYDTRQLLADAEALADAAGTTGKAITRDEAVKEAQRRLQLRQLYELTQAMGLDPRSPNFWRDAFARLAEIDHNVGRLIHRWTPSKKKIKSPLSKMWEQASRVEQVEAARGSNSVRETFRLFAQPKAESSEDVRARADRTRADKQRQRYYRAKREITSAKRTAANLPPESLTKPTGLLCLSEFETLLFNIENNWPKVAPLGGDN
jgi:hypothetical protein